MREIVIDTETTGLGKAEEHLMPDEPIYLVTDACKPVTAFTTNDEMKAYLKRRRGALNRPLVYRIDGEGHAPVIMIMSRVLADG